MIELFLSRYCHRTRRAYTGDLARFGNALRKPVPTAIAIFLDSSPSDRIEMLEHYTRALSGFSLETYRRRVGILSNISGFAWREGIIRERIDVSTFNRQTWCELAATISTQTAVLTNRDLQLFRSSLVADKSREGLRDLALFDLIVFRLVRAWEVRALKRHQLDLHQKEIWLMESITKRVCRYDLDETTCASLHAWMANHPVPECPLVFVRLNRGRRSPSEPLSGPDLHALLTKRGREAGLKTPTSARALLHAATGAKAKDITSSRAPWR